MAHFALINGGAEIEIGASWGAFPITPKESCLKGKIGNDVQNGYLVQFSLWGLSGMPDGGVSRGHGSERLQGD